MKEFNWKKNETDKVEQPEGIEDTKENSFWKSKKFIVPVLVVNVILIVCLSTHLYSTYSRRISTDAIASAKNEKVTNEDIGKINSEMSNTYLMLLSGCTFNPSEDVTFSFGTDGSYAGFYDSDNKNVSGYSYEVTLQDNSYVLNLYNEDKSKVVSYNMTINEDGNIVLSYPGTDGEFVLSF